MAIGPLELVNLRNILRVRNLPQKWQISYKTVLTHDSRRVRRTRTLDRLSILPRPAFSAPTALEHRPGSRDQNGQICGINDTAITPTMRLNGAPSLR